MVAQRKDDAVDVPRNEILCGDALTELRKLPDGCVQTVVTSPPYYGLRSYETPPVIWGGISTCKHEWGEAQRTPWANEVPGPNGRKKNLEASHNRTKTTGPFCQLCQAWRGELGQEPSPALYIAHLVQVFREVGRVLRKDGTLWLNIGDSAASVGRAVRDTAPISKTGLRNPSAGLSRSTDPDGIKPKDILMLPHRVAIALQDDGWYVRSDIVWAKKNCMPESVKDRPTRAHEYIFLLTKNERYYYNNLAILEPVNPNTVKREKRGYRHAFANQFKGSPRENRHQDGKVLDHVTNPDGRNARSVWTFPSSPFPDAHFATFPVELPTRCILAGSQIGDLVFDPFAGAGTTLMVAKRLGRDYLGIELNPTYVAMAEDRITRDTLPEAMKHVDLRLVPRSLWDDEEGA